MPNTVILINKDIKLGEQYVGCCEPVLPKVLYKEVFENSSKCGTYYEALPGAVSIKEGKLELDRYNSKLKGLKDPSGGDLRIKMGEILAGFASMQNLSQGAMDFEFDLVFTACSGIRLSFDRTGRYGRDLTGVDYIIGNYRGKKAGIYVFDGLKAALKNAYDKKCHISIITTPSYTELCVNDKKCSVKYDEKYLGQGQKNEFAAMVLSCDGKCKIDNFVIQELPSYLLQQDYPPQLLGFNTKMRQVAILKGSGKEWQKLASDKPLYFYQSRRKDENNESVLIAEAKMVDDDNNFIICSIEKGSLEEIKGETTISLVRDNLPFQDNVATNKADVIDESSGPEEKISVVGDGIVESITNNMATIKLYHSVTNYAGKVGFSKKEDVFTRTGTPQEAVVKLNLFEVADCISKTNGDFVYVPLLSRSDCVSSNVSPEDIVFIDSSIKTGNRYVMCDARYRTITVYENLFDDQSDLENSWDSKNGVLSVKEGRLIASPSRKKQNRNGADLQIDLARLGLSSRYYFDATAPASKPMAIEYDLYHKTEQDICVRFCNARNIKYKIVISRDGLRTGIYCSDRPAAVIKHKPSLKHHVVIRTTPRMIELDVDGQSCRCELQDLLARENIDGLEIRGNSRFEIADFRIKELPYNAMGADYPARILGFNQGKDQVAVAKGADDEWHGPLCGKTVYFYQPAAEGASMPGNPVEAKIMVDENCFVVCQLDENAAQAVKEDARISFSRVSQAAKPNALPAREGICDGEVSAIKAGVATIELFDPSTNKAGMKMGFCDIVSRFYSLEDGLPIAVKMNIFAASSGTMQTQEQNIRVPLRDITGNNINVSPGTLILLDDKINLGSKWMENDLLVPVLICEEMFNDNVALNTCIESIKGAVSLDDGKLTLDRYRNEFKQLSDPNPGDMRINLEALLKSSAYSAVMTNLVPQAMDIEFDLDYSDASGVSIMFKSDKDLLGVNYVIGKYREKYTGIYLNNKLDSTIGHALNKKLHVLIRIAPALMELRAGSDKCLSVCDHAYFNKKLTQMIISCDNKIKIAGLKIWKLPDYLGGSKYPARIAGVSGDKKSVIVLRGADKAWEDSLINKSIRFFPKESNASPGSDNKPQSINGVVTEERRDYLVCALSDGSKGEIKADMTVSISATGKKDSQDATSSLVGKNEKCPVFVTTEAGDKTSFIIKSLFPYEIPRQGYLYEIEDIYTHPVTQHLLGARIGRGVRCKFSQNEHGDTVASSDETVPGFPKDNILNLCVVSHDELLKDACVEAAGRTYRCEFNPAEQPFFDVISGEWRKVNGRYRCSSPKDPKGVPMAVARHFCNGNMQFQFDVIVEKAVQQMSCQYVKDISCLFYSVSNNTGLTIGLGAEGYGGVSVDKGTPSVLGSVATDRFTEFNKLGESVRGGHARWVRGGSEAKLGHKYEVIIRRINNTFYFYVNNRRLLTYECLNLGKEIQTWFIAPESIISVGNICLMELPKNLKSVPQIPLSGEFGYIVSVNDKYAYIDSDLAGLKPGAFVSVVTTDQALRGITKDNRVMSVKYKCVAKGSVIDVGKRLAKIIPMQTLQSKEPVRRGMKVYLGSLPDSFTLSASQLTDLDFEPDAKLDFQPRDSKSRAVWKK